MNNDQKDRLQYLRTKKKLSKGEWKELKRLVDLQYETGENDPVDDDEDEKLAN